ncbi:ABC-2 type transport system ATP-binding protein [Caulobacter ginsengisoli]|uniref:ABC-2 type transport system ATP-binding protein n=1 Tax=Caulobacter ginsengisoli TaxID=400775 RepID=A0ABU0IQR3_9CAUL|nr:ABC transporter ATP-binding protein [Caulobacter ginsengisoli]MDQ0463740.1 ABC-2 type transport system ATP-binding protein [Caulobacter ginsengisoli]
MSTPVLNVWNAEFAYRSRKALRGVDLVIRRGEIYGLLGPNGAGKSTLIGVICGRLKLTAGEVALEGADPWNTPAARAALGLAPQEIALYDHLTIRENLEVFGRLSQVPGKRIQDAVTRAMNLTRTVEREHVPVKHLSGGYRRRVNIAAAILHEPRLLILDEPTVGVDVDAREALDGVIRDLRDSGVAVLLVTHDLEQAGALADRVGFLKEGRKVLEGAPRELVRQAFGEEMEILVHLPIEASPEQRTLLVGEGLEERGSSHIWAKLDKGGYTAAGQIDKKLRKAGLIPNEIRVREPSLHNLFTLVADWRRAA